MRMERGLTFKKLFVVLNWDDNFKLEYPLFLSNMGSGVSIINFESKEIYSRLTGTPIGGGVAYGLGLLLSSNPKSNEAT